MFTNEEADEAEENKDPLAGLDMAYGKSWCFNIVPKVFWNLFCL